jgi:hypothetical protein
VSGTGGGDQFGADEDAAGVVELKISFPSRLFHQINLAVPLIRKVSDKQKPLAAKK